MKIVRIVSLLLLLGSVALSQAQQPPAGQAPGAQRGQGGRGGGQPRVEDPRDMGGGQCAQNVWNCKDTPSPVPHLDTVWIEELTWMGVRDAVKAGKDTLLIATGGMEPNGPFLVTGKHNYVLHANCEAIARKMGNALCAPIVKFVPEGNIDPPASHMKSPGTISLREETFQAMLEDIARSLKVSTGFKTIVFFGDSGGNQGGMKAVAEKLNKEFKDTTVVFVPEYYTYNAVSTFMRTNGIPEGGKSDNLHDDPIITLNMFIDDPKSVSYDQRVKAGNATINGFSIADRKKSTELAKKIVDFRAQYTIDALKKALAANKKS